MHVCIYAQIDACWIIESRASWFPSSRKQAESKRRASREQVESKQRASGASWLFTCQEWAERVDNRPPFLPTSLPIWDTLIFLNNMFNSQISYPGCVTRRENIDCWRVAWSLCSAMRGWCNWKMFHSNGFLIFSWYLTRPGMILFMSS